MFKGSITALITPFLKGEVDEKSLRKLVNWQISKGTNGLVPTGTTGESPTLTHEEHRRVIEIVVEEAKGRVPVIAGTGSNSTKEAISLTRHAKEVGADGALLIAPYYNRPNQKGIYEHFKTIAAKVDIPIVLYNHQGRTGITIQPDTIEALSKVGRFVAVKDASGGINYTSETLDRTGGKVAVLSGNDSWTLSLMALGAAGCISVVSNVIPAEMSRMIAEYQAGNVEKSRKLFYKILPLMNAMDLDVNPVPVKAAMGLLGKAENSVRLPLLSLAEDKKAILRKAMVAHKLVK